MTYRSQRSTGDTGTSGVYLRNLLGNSPSLLLFQFIFLLSIFWEPPQNPARDLGNALSSPVDLREARAVVDFGRFWDILWLGRKLQRQNCV